MLIIIRMHKVPYLYFIELHYHRCAANACMHLCFVYPSNLIQVAKFISDLGIINIF